MATLSIPVKGGGSIDVDTETLNTIPEDAYKAILAAGLKDFLNRRMSKVTTKGLEGSALDAAKEAAMKIARENYDNVLAGNISGPGAKSKASGIPREVQTEALRLAKNVVKDQIRAAKQRISDYKASEITRVAKELLNQDATLIERARQNLEQAPKPSVSIDVSALKPDPELVAKAAAKKAEAKAKRDTLSAAQAGKASKRTAPPAKGSVAMEATA